MRNLEKEQRLGRNGIENLCIKPTFNYCTSKEQFTFFKLPKCLIDDACFWGLSIDAKLLYAIFLDRVSLSIKNGWVDETGRVFIYYSVINILANFIGEMVAKYADAMGLDQLLYPDNYLRMKRMKQLYMELYKTENIEKFRSIIIPIERNAAA